MDRAYQANAVVSPPSAPAIPSIGYPSENLAATQPGPWWFHMIVEEMRAIVVAGGLTPAFDTLTQVRDACFALFGRLNANNTWTKANRGAFVTLTSSGASVAVDLALSNNYVHALTENTTLAAPTNAVAGQSGFIEFNQHASAPKTLAYNAFWKFAGGTVPTLTAVNSARDVLSYTINADSASATCSMLKDVK